MWGVPGGSGEDPGSAELGGEAEESLQGPAGSAIALTLRIPMGERGKGYVSARRDPQTPGTPSWGAGNRDGSREWE